MARKQDEPMAEAQSPAENEAAQPTTENQPVVAAENVDEAQPAVEGQPTATDLLRQLLTSGSVDRESLLAVLRDSMPSAGIYLLHDYGGRRTNEQRIPAGTYRRDDPRLMGLADYLVENGHAVAL